MRHRTPLDLPFVHAAPAAGSAGVMPDYARGRDRSQYPPEVTWNLGDLYPSKPEWDIDKKEVLNALPRLKTFEGKLASGPSPLLGCLDLLSTVGKTMARLYCYASMLSDQDTRVSAPLGMQQEIQQLSADVSARTAFIEPEILAAGADVVETFLKKEPGLQSYAFYLRDILRRKEHTSTAEGERIIAEAGLMASAPHDIFSIFSNADFPYPTITLNDGSSARLDASAFPVHRASPVREDRAQAMRAFFGTLGTFERTFGTQLTAEIRKNMFTSRARRYPSALHAALDANNIPTDVYHALIGGVNDHRATFHRYLSLRRRILGVDTLHYHDLYAPLLSDVELRYSAEEAKAHVLDSLAPLGDDYRDVVRRSFTERWIDMYPSDGKRSGAYSNGAAYDVHPYILMNYNGKYDDMSTLTHELGHTMHSHFSNTNQPWILSHYSIFAAEVASTLNEALLVHHMLRNTTDDRVRLSILGNTLEGFKGTVFRQTQFAEFELAIHERSEQGEALTGEAYTALYRDLARRYYGHDDGACTIDDHVAWEWAYIPHFYYNFYVYQYATSFTASSMLAEQILAGDATARKKYRAFLSSGGSQYPVDQLREAGVDMTGPEPLTYTMKRMNAIMDDIEAILARLPKT